VTGAPGSAVGLRQAPLAGMALAVAGYAVFSLQDASVKWLVADYAVVQILFMRSLTIVVLGLIVGHRAGIARALVASPNKRALALRALVMLVAWLCYYSAARHLALPDLVTLYYASPLFVVVLSIALLGERVTAARWIAVLLGLAGVVVAADPTGEADLLPAALVVIAAVLWAWSTILVRQIMRSESTLTQMMFTSAVFLAVCGATLPWTWRTPDAEGLALMFGLGVASGVAQMLLYEGMRRAPASAIAPCEYTSLVWAYLLGWMIWGDVPAMHVVAGGALIVAGSLVAVAGERRRPLAEPPA
jgi:S-adenosylmethionine uptake transporter